MRLRVDALSMTAAILFGEELAAVVAALMYAGGQNLDTLGRSKGQRPRALRAA